MKCIDSFVIYSNWHPLLVSRQAVFPGIVQLPEGDLLAMFSIGQAFDASDMRAYHLRSVDLGKSWSDPVRLGTTEADPEESESFKPLLLRDGTLLATGYVFVRPTPLTPVVDPDTFALLPIRNKWSRSTDGGRTWSDPQYFSVEGAPLELSGAPIELQSGRLIAATAPFHLGKTGHAGWIIASDDRGENWSKLSEFFRSSKGNVASWECRLAEISPCKVAVLFWAYDNEAGANLANHLCLSTNGGETFGSPINTGVRAQASNIMPLDGDRVLTIHAHRETPVGLVVRRVNLAGDGFAIEEELDLLDERNLAADSADIRQQFASLKFGQPSLLRLQDGNVLAACWSFENHQHVIKGYRIAL